MAGDRLEILSLDGLEVVERVQQCAEPDQRQRLRVRLDRDCTVRVPCGEERVHSRRGLGLERGDEVHADRHVREEVRSLRRLGAGLVRDQDLLVRNQAHRRAHVVAWSFEDACRHEPVRVEPRKRRRGVLPRHLVSEEEEPDQGVERLPLGYTLKVDGDVGGASVELAVDAEPLLQAVGGIAGRDEQRAQRRNGPGVIEAWSGVGRCVRAHEDTWGIRYRCRARGVAQPG